MEMSKVFFLYGGRLKISISAIIGRFLVAFQEKARAPIKKNVCICFIPYKYTQNVRTMRNQLEHRTEHKFLSLTSACCSIQVVI